MNYERRDNISERSNFL